MATARTRTVRKGAISFGLVHIPVALYTAIAETRPKFNLIDKASMSPVGNQQISKTTGEAVQREELVNDMAEVWSPDLFHDEFKEKLDQLVQRKARAGDVATVQALPGEEVAQPSAKLIDLTELLKRSLKEAAPASRGGRRGQIRGQGASQRQARPASQVGLTEMPANRLQHLVR